MEGIELPGFKIYPSSLQKVGESTLFLARQGVQKFLVVVGKKPARFRGRQMVIGGKKVHLCPADGRNLRVLMSLFPFLRPKPAWLRPSVGFGDRLGLATPGHVRAARRLKIFPVLAQQSARELEKTGRSFGEVLEDAIWGVFQGGYTEGFGSDADHLTKLSQVREAAKAGYTGFTLDPSPYLCPADRVDLKKVSLWSPPAELMKDYTSFEIVPGLRLEFGKDEALQLATKFARSLRFVQQAWMLLRDMVGEFDFEISLDETPQPTSPKEHFFFVRELKLRGVRTTSFAPKFSGVFEKAVDYRGNLKQLKEEIRVHYLISQHLGPYKLSIHSGSDKNSIYPLLVGLPVHIKTSGTSYLLALRVVERRDPELFGKIKELAIRAYGRESESYRGLVSASADEASLEGRGRQVFHVTYGAVLGKLGGELKRVLLENEEEYHSLLEQHFQTMVSSFASRR